MNKRTLSIFVAALILIAGTAVCLAHFRSHQKLGRPAVKTSPIPGNNRLQVELPEHVLNYKSEFIETDPIVLGTLPPDTSFGQRIYMGPDGWQMAMSVVLMGADRTSLHKPQFCLQGQGHTIDLGASTEEKIHVDRPYPYELPVVKLLATKQAVDANGQTQSWRCVYVYWFVADGSVSASVSGIQRMWWMARDLARTGVLQRWSYVSCLARCAPGQENATFERMKTFIAASVPEFQLTAPMPQVTASAIP